MIMLLIRCRKVSQKGFQRLREHHARVPGHLGNLDLVPLERRVQLVGVPDPPVPELGPCPGHGPHARDQRPPARSFRLDLPVVGLDHGKDQVDFSLRVHVDVRLLHDLDLELAQHLVVEPFLARFPEFGNLARAVVPEAHGMDVGILVEDVVEEIVLGVEGVDLEVGFLGGAVYPRNSGGFCGDDVEIEALGLHHADQPVAVQGAVAAGEEDGQAGGVADREFDLVDLIIKVQHNHMARRDEVLEIKTFSSLSPVCYFFCWFWGQSSHPL